MLCTNLASHRRKPPRSYLPEEFRHADERDGVRFAFGLIHVFHRIADLDFKFSRQERLHPDLRFPAGA